MDSSCLLTNNTVVTVQNTNLTHRRWVLYNKRFSWFNRDIWAWLDSNSWAGYWGMTRHCCQVAYF